jgi:hypothetical protein
MKWNGNKSLAITMWDFSWLERRWPGAGYGDWGRILDELKMRGYDAVRIEAYPHLISADKTGFYELLPVWNTSDWGSPAPLTVSPYPALIEFIEACGEREILIALSSWFRQDKQETGKGIKTPEDLAKIWTDTLITIEKAGLLDSILYVDLCNEFPHQLWTPFLPEEAGHDITLHSRNTLLYSWMNIPLDHMRSRFPDTEFTFSNIVCKDWKNRDLSILDFLELHIWMAAGDFYKQVGYNYERFDPAGYEKIAANAEKIYRQNPEHWLGVLKELILTAAEESVSSGRYLGTTEGWGIVDYKDWPGLDWGWVKETCAYGVSEALKTGRWKYLCTSNFRGPQFRGMWDDISWHQRLAKQINAG